MSVPADPETFFTRYVPERFAAIASGLAGKTSPGSLCFRVIGAGEWVLRLRDGALSVEAGTADDTIVQISVRREDFEPLVVRGAERLEQEPASLDGQLVAFRALSLDEERANLIRGISGNVALSVVDGEARSRVVLTPGTATPNFDAPECEVSIELADFLALQQGRQNPIELLMANKIRITGNAQIALALSGLFT